MRTRRVTTVVFLVLALVGASPGLSDTELEGKNRGGAYYKIVVPDNWNGDLVIWNHGFSLSKVGPVDDVGPLSDVHLLLGYAVAASSYRMNGWALFKTNADLRQLVKVFTREFGRPEQIIVYGASLGGAVTAAALENGRLGNVVGALALCGAMAGSRNWDAALDLRLVYDLICEDMPGAAIPGGAKGLPKKSGWSDDDVEQAVDACTGVNKPKIQRTPQQQANLDRLLDLAQIPRSFLVTDMQFATRGMSNLVHPRKKLRGKLGTGNANVFYGDSFVDANIERVSPSDKARKRLQNNFTPKGNVGQTKIVSMHTSKDGLVIVENQSAYAEVVPPENLTTAIVRERQATHCVFSPGEVLAGWSALEDWIRTGEQPTAADIQATCEALPFLGELCRIDPNFVVEDIDSKIRPR